jgi:hypothetical protein
MVVQVRDVQAPVGSCPDLEATAELSAKGDPPSPLKPTLVPPPAQVCIFPSAVTRRTACGLRDAVVSTMLVK